MKIGINGYEAVVPRFGFDKKTGLPNRVGSGEFCFQILSELARIDNTNNYSVFLPTPPSKDLPPERDRWKYEVFRSKKLWTLLGLSKRLMREKGRFDVFFSPTHYLPLFTGVPPVIAILDVSYLYFPELFKKKDLNQLKFWGGYSIRKAKKIITISNSSKNDIIKAYHVPEDKVEVIYPGVKKIQDSGFTIYNMEELKKKFGIEGNYILFVGTLQPRKNITRLVEAFSMVVNRQSRFSGDARQSQSKSSKSSRSLSENLSSGQTQKDVTVFDSPQSGLPHDALQLVIVGKKGWQYEEILEAPKKYGVETSVKFLENVTDEELPSLYKNALCFVLPSLYEGFGLPILEAMQYGCPVLTSNVSSLPEAGGDAALYFNPENVEDITKNLKLITQNSKLREELIKKGYEQIKKFSWEKSARKTLGVLEELGKQG